MSSRRLLACFLAAIASCAILLAPRFARSQPHLRTIMSAFAPRPLALDIDATLAALTLDEKIRLLAGQSACSCAESCVAAYLQRAGARARLRAEGADDPGEWQTSAIPRLGIPSVRVSDGPNGIRGSLCASSARSLR